MQVAYLPSDRDVSDTTVDVDYIAVSKGKECSWFPGEIKKMREDDMVFPCYSHGFDGQLARIHREQPNLSLSLIHISEPTRPY